jgi:predicted nuclease of predicted toxin-antitoxin system
VRFLVDAQLPPALARWLASQGHEAEHVIDIGLAGAADRTIWQQASERGAVIVTKDEDFALHRTLEINGPAVVWVRLGNTRKVDLLRWLEPLLPEVLVALERGETLIEVA